MSNNYQKTKPKCCCVGCGKEISINNIDKHYEGKDCGRAKTHYPEDLACVHCGKQCKNKNSWVNHSRLCPYNPNRDPNHIGGMTGKRGSNQFSKARRLGLPIPESKLKGKPTHGTLHTEETKQRLSKIVNEKVAKGEWHTSLAKDHHYSYEGVTLHGTWELYYAMWLDENNITWTRCRETFNYTYKGQTRRYLPDFYLDDIGSYIEIKGYKTEKDDAKWSQFPEDKELIVLMEEDLKELGVL